MALLLSPLGEASERVLAESIEADTRYARKFVRVAVRRGELDRAFRPLLPLRPPSDLEVDNPLDELRDELRALDVPDAVLNAALDAFERTEAVDVP